MTSPKPPSGRCTASSHATADRTAGWSAVTTQAATAGRKIGPANGPIAVDRNLLRDEPLAGAAELWMRSRHARIEQCDHREGRIPDRGLTGLGAEPVSLVDREAAPAVDGCTQRLVLEPMPECGEHDDRPDPGRLDPAPRPVCLLAVADPALGSRERDAADRPRPWRRLRLARASTDLL